MHKFNTNDIVKSTTENNCFFKIRAAYDDCYDAAYCDKNGKLLGGSIDIWRDNTLEDEGYAVEANFEKVG